MDPDIENLNLEELRLAYKALKTKFDNLTDVHNLAECRFEIYKKNTDLVLSNYEGQLRDAVKIAVGREILTAKRRLRRNQNNVEPPPPPPARVNRGIQVDAASLRTDALPPPPPPPPPPPHRRRHRRNQIEAQAVWPSSQSNIIQGAHRLSQAILYHRPMYSHAITHRNNYMSTAFLGYDPLRSFTSTNVASAQLMPSRNLPGAAPPSDTSTSAHAVLYSSNNWPNSDSVRPQTRFNNASTNTSRSNPSAPHSNLPVPHSNQPAPRRNLPAPRSNPPASRGNRPALRGNSAMSRSNPVTPHSDPVTPRGNPVTPRGNSSARASVARPANAARGRSRKNGTR